MAVALPSPINVPTIAPDLSLLQHQEETLTLPSFTSDTAWTLGNIIRKNLLTKKQASTTAITLATTPPQLLFGISLAGAVPDNQIWMERKRATVLRFGTSSWHLQQKYAGDETLFAQKMGLGSEASRYAIHGGGWPVRVRGVEGVVGAIVVSGLSQEQDHAVIIAALREYLESLGEVLPVFDENEKKKED